METKVGTREEAKMDTDRGTIKRRGWRPRGLDELRLQSVFGLTPEEKSEYEHLQTLYRDLQMDPDDPMKPVYDRDH
jgi:hypothetical protein